MEFNLPKEERKILKLWKNSQIFQRSLKKRELAFTKVMAGKKRPVFVFYDGPITVNAKPGIHHVLSRIFKDLIPRYKTMQGYYVERKNGWDTHGLPVELEVEKILGFNSKKDIEKYGIAKFNRECKKNVQRYLPMFKDLTEKIGYWVDMDNPYITYDNRYIESLWWIIKQIWEKRLLYEDFKVVPWCPRCGTALSSHEVALGYKNIEENSIYVKFKIKAGQKINEEEIDKNTYFLAWTTTPWTLPGNVALAVGKNIDYIKVEDKISTDKYILAKDNYQHVLREYQREGEREYKVIEKFKGRDLIGLSYEPLYRLKYVEIYTHKAYIYRIISGDFVSTEEGTGIVHIAPAFGEDDLRIGKENDLPPLITVGEDGKMGPGIIGEGKFVKDADPLIIEDLRRRNLIFKEEMYTHDYPFCWRCHSPLLYYANPRKSWFIKVTAIKDKLIENSRVINWFPSHLKEGRFGEWLKEVKDWAFSRERFWGTPLPIWKCSQCDYLEVIGSKDDLRAQKFTTNRYFIMRHGFAETNLKGIVSSSPDKNYSLTKFGKFQTKKAVKKLKKIIGTQKLDVIISSDLRRCVQTSEIFAKELGLKVKYDSRIREINHGEWEGKSLLKFRAKFQIPPEKFFKEGPPGGENWNDCKKRMINFIEDIDQKYHNKNILIVSHGDPLWLLQGAMEGFENNDFLNRIRVKRGYIKKGELQEIKFRKFPYNEKEELDLHRPYIDKVKFLCPKCGRRMLRVKEVCDVWFDSGAMPFAQYHYPFENKDLIDNGLRFPADYIAEAIDQTRGWFYTLLAVSTLLGEGTSYKNVICLGHVLDQKGEKMSKSKGNIIDPWKMIENYGADALRWYFFTINQPGESKRFDERDVRKCFNKFILTFWNIFLFWKEYSPDLQLTTHNLKLENVLDKWIVSKFYSLTKNIITLLDKYDIVSAAREIENFVIEDFSRWYIRRSRSRFQRPKNSRELKKASEILGFLILELSKLCAPFLPFISEIVYQEIGKKNSVHLENFPEPKEKLINKKLEEKMISVRKIVSLGLQKRKEAKIKVRQPLREFKIENLDFTPEEEILELLKEELNVKEIKIKKGKGEINVSFDFKITPALKDEGILREIIRILQDMRKEGRLKKEDKIEIFYKDEGNLGKIIEKNKDLIKKITIAKEIKEIKKPPYLVEKKIILEGGKSWLAIKKI